MVQSSASVEIVLLSSVVSCDRGCFTWFLLLQLQHPQLMSDAPCYFHTYGSFYIRNVRYYQGPEDNKVFFKNVKKKNVSFVQIHLNWSSLRGTSCCASCPDGPLSYPHLFFGPRWCFVKMHFGKSEEHSGTCRLTTCNREIKWSPVFTWAKSFKPVICWRSSLPCGSQTDKRPIFLNWKSNKLTLSLSSNSIVNV